MSSQVVSIPSSVFYAPPSSNRISAFKPGESGSSALRFRGDSIPLAAFGALSTSTIFPFDIFLFERIILVREDYV